MNMMDHIPFKISLMKESAQLKPCFLCCNTMHVLLCNECIMLNNEYSIVEQWLALSPHSKRVMGLNPPAGWGLSVFLNLHGYSGFLPQMQVTDDSGLPIGVKMSVNGCLSLYTVY